ncbi:tyrosine-type recombinase/integrase [Parasutterella excrementihominis]|uniref:tyrosine-type recombinase/integrase n=1 Tax=Parasutterella excrementihominis TaxID=487175 RepID=UPI00242E8EE5|nr:site-specific integrase [Parasutterella excrementihominis]
MFQHNVGGVKGLYLRKTQNQQIFFLRYSDSTGRHDYSLGSYPLMSVSQARRAAFDTWELINHGKSPIEERRKEKLEKQLVIEQARKDALSQVQTFEKVALEWVDDRALHGYWSQDIKGEKKTRQILARHVFPKIGKENIETITLEKIRECLEPIWQTIPSTAKKVKSYIQKIFQWAIALGKRENRENPALMDGALGILMEPLQKNKKEKQNHAASPVGLLPRLMSEIHSYDSMSAKACEFAILTACRSKAVRLAEWSEFDLEKGIWQIPVEHDKIKVPNRDRTIFLSAQALALLEGLVRFSESPYIFPSSQGSHFSDTALTMFLRGLHEKKLAEDGIGWIDPQKSQKLNRPCTITVHGTARATFRTWAKDDELGNNRKFDQEAVELCLLHSKNDAYNGAYDRAKLEKERRFIMDCWGKYCHSQLKKQPQFP